MSVVCIEKEATKDALRYGRIAKLFVFKRDKQGKRTMEVEENFEPYFYVPESEVVLPTEGIKRVDKGFRLLTEEKVKRLIFGPGADPFKLKEIYPTNFESDYKYINRYMTDMKLGYDKNAHISVFDIEVDSKNRFPNPQQGKWAITAISIYDYKMNKLIWMVQRPDFDKRQEKNRFVFKEGKIDINVPYNKYYFPTERELLMWFIKYIKERNSDILTGWNIKKFDLPYIIKRCEVLKIDYSGLSPLRKVYTQGDKGAIIEGRIILDLLPFYKKLQLAELDSYKLDVVAEHVCGVGKIKHVVSLGELWRTNLPKFELYSVLDSVLVWQINEMEDVIPFVLEMADISSCLPQLVQYNKDIVDAYVMKWCHGKWVLPTRARGRKGDYEGAVVLDAIPGVHKNVIGLDLKSLYPSIIISYNMSPETLIKPDDPLFNKVPKVHAGGDTYFRTDKPGLIPTMLTNLFDVRKEKENLRDSYSVGTPEYEMYYRQQFAIKGIMNSFYGMLAFIDFRLYTVEIAAAVTRIGREIIQWTKKEAEKLGFEVIYGDTDSVFIKLRKSWSKKKIIEYGAILAADITESYNNFAHQYGVKEHIFKLVFEKVYKRILFVKGDKKGKGVKKRYAGLLVWLKGKLCKKFDITGFDAIKSDSSALSRDLQKSVLEKVLTGASREVIRKIVQTIIRKMEANEYEWDEIGIPMGLGKPLHLYSGNWANHAHIRGAKYSNQWLGTSFGSGTKPKRVYIRSVPPGFEQTDVICVDGDTIIPAGFVINRDAMIEACIEKKLTRILDTLGWRWKDIGGKYATKDLLSYFK
jgi:DNA polymerase elongation subunit (family B)